MRKLKFNQYPRFIALPLLIGFILRTILLNSPIVGVHSWRQADTAAMARHFYLNNTPIWLPQIDWAGNGEGFVESEFPIFPYLTAQLYKLFGIHEWIGRSFSVIFSLLTILLIIRIGELLINKEAGWWGGILFSILPMSVYYGRAFQAESLLLLLSALSLERLIESIRSYKYTNLLISWAAFVLACLIKVLPLVWLGLPLITTIILARKERDQKNSFIGLTKRLASSQIIYIYMLGALLILYLWYSHAYEIGKLSGLSFGFWEDSDRSSFSMLFNTQMWGNLILRTSIRCFAILGLPLLFIGIRTTYKGYGGKILISGIIGILLTLLISIRSSSIHEYYQLPLLIFSCPFMGQGVQVLIHAIKKEKLHRKVLRITLIFIGLISINILAFDYYLLEKRQTKIWLPLALEIRNNVPLNERIVSVTNHDPTLLNLGRRQGWLVSASSINKNNIELWFKEGASFIVGSLNWAETYATLPEGTTKKNLNDLLCNAHVSESCPKPPNFTYIIPIKNLIN
ncbi:ArnT family glycosyltransferase [Prochlorococcus marinus]|uniref:4-amino-4-deoxy-L-arabinose transferase and related glycosyltransferases of PMT family n=1 Tax=Prochlorococcus marinus (strain MIT 9211) TaxID=93059 RepID=A9BBI0_PROM4|nr:glycosyltransferase family 39 protein [Prochlorococcus marinus]ABX09192.1 4-amino-4-deoxy-L-arabinose transferase and related glycosyltransferases of PMT family [Prochlorococcus marinus str. MIT 9211]